MRSFEQIGRCKRVTPRVGLAQRLRMLAMWALHIASPSRGLIRSVAAGLFAGLGKPSAHHEALSARNGVPTFREALRGRWDI